MSRNPVKYATCLCSLSALLAAAGCSTPALFYQPPPPPAMLGTQVDQINLLQEENAEASKFVIYQHEFELNKIREDGTVEGTRLNESGQDHVRRIAENMRNGAPYPIVVERSQTSAKADTKYNYPVHYNSELDLKRREVVVRALTRMGIADADTRVVVAPAFAQPLTGNEAQGAYASGMGGMGGMGGGMGGGFGGGMGGGGWF